MEELSRLRMLIGKDKVDILQGKRVIVFGIGGVGGFTCEALARCGIGTIDLVDNDTVSLSNINRQIIALHSTVGRYKTEVMKERIYDINPNIVVNIHNTFVTKENINQFDFTKYDYVVDAIDSVPAKVELAYESERVDTPIIASMGTGNKLNPLDFKVADIYKTSVCPLARVMREKLRKRGVKKLRVVYSTEEPTVAERGEGGYVPASCAFTPSVAGFILASEVIKDLIK